MYATSCVMSSAFNFFPNAGIFPLPLVIDAASSASDFFCTASDRRSWAFSALPEVELPLPSGAWHNTQLVLYVFSASFCAFIKPGNAITANPIVNGACDTCDTTGD